MRALSSYGCGLAVLFATLIAQAEPTPEERTLATELFDQGRALMGERRYGEACPKLAESMRLVPGGGTLLNLALCHEAEGKTATAWAEFKTALGMARRDKRPDRIELAEQRVQELEPKLSRLTITVDARADTNQLEIRQDGVKIGHAAWGTELPVDPGEHHIEASAQGKRPVRLSVTIGANADRQTLVIPPLEAAPQVKPQAAAPEKTAAGPTSTLSHGPSALVIGLGVTGLVGIGVGSFFGARAISKKNDYQSDCADGCSQRGADALDQAKTSADISTVGFAAGAVAIGLATYFWITEKPSSRTGNGRALTWNF